MNDILLNVENDDILINFLKKNIRNKSKNNIKTMLLNNQIYVNDRSEKRYDYGLKKGDKVLIKSFRSTINNIKIIYEDNDLIVIDKPSGLLSISTSKEKDITAYHIVSNYVKEKNKNNRIFILHRLDKDTSGILMFAKSEKIKKLFQGNWNKNIINRCYYAIIHGKMKEETGIIKSYLTENEHYMVHSTKNKNIGKIAITEYKTLKENDKYSLLDINIKTGRKNQIRVHLSENGNSIVGDEKYGIKDNRLYLHAYKLELIDPRSKKILKFETDIPREFRRLI